MRHGQVVEQGPTAGIFANPSHAYTRGLLACRPRLDLRRDRLPTVDEIMAAEGSATA